MIHLGIIPDGNRRYGKKHKLDFFLAYMKGKDRLKGILNFVLDSEEINEVTIYALSYKNCINRSKFELKIVEYIIIEGFDELLKDKRIKNVLMTFHGSITDGVIGNELQKKIFELKDKADNPVFNKKINFLIAYDETHYTYYDYPINPIDLIVRTGGYKRLSGFCPIESANAELFFVDKLFPEFTVEDLKDIIEEFKKIKRNFGR